MRTSAFPPCGNPCLSIYLPSFSQGSMHAYSVVSTVLLRDVQLSYLSTPFHLARTSSSAQYLKKYVFAQKATATATTFHSIVCATKQNTFPAHHYLPPSTSYSGYLGLRSWEGTGYERVTTGSVPIARGLSWLSWRAGG